MLDRRKTISIQIRPDETHLDPKVTTDLVYGRHVPFTLTVGREKFEGAIRPEGDIRWPIDWYDDPPDEAKYIVFWSTHWTGENLEECHDDECTKGEDCDYIHGGISAEMYLSEFRYNFTDEVRNGIYNDKYRLTKKEEATA